MGLGTYTMNNIYLITVLIPFLQASNGWLFQMGIMDYAGGIPVHISSGLAAGTQK